MNNSGGEPGEVGMNQWTQRQSTHYDSTKAKRFLSRSLLGKRLALVGGLCSLALLAACSPAPSEAPRQLQHTDLHQHSEEFAPQVIEVREGIHVAVGYGLANSIMIEGDDGLIIVDTMESRDTAAQVLAE